MPLSDTAIRNAKPKTKPYKLPDSGGLYLLIHPSGGKRWRYKYRWLGKEKLLAFGTYPDVKLVEAREAHAKARKILAAGNDPGEAKKEEKRQVAINHENSFEAIAREWHESRKEIWTPRYAEFMLKRLEADVFPKLGARPIANISAPELLSVLRLIEKRGALEMAQRAMQTCSQIFMFGIVTGRAKDNPAINLKGALKTPKKKHYAHLDAVDLPEFFQRLETYDGNIQTKLALKLLVLTFVRTAELRGMQWPEINFDKSEWRISAERMKMRTAHIVPLSEQAVKILQEMKKYTGSWNYVFTNQFKPIKCMSENTILYALYRMGYRDRATGHGFRHTASTILNENGFKGDAIERQLAHMERKKVRGVYNHAEYLPERKKMMQWWADYLDEASEEIHSKEGR